MWRAEGVPVETVAAQYVDLTGEIVAAVRAVVRIPIICKLTPMTSDLPEVAEACEKAGADARRPRGIFCSCLRGADRRGKSGQDHQFIIRSGIAAGKLKGSQPCFRA